MEVALPYLDKNTASRCPAEIKEFAEYLSFELGTKVAQKRIHFVRTARIGKVKYWLFRAKPLDEAEAWAFVHTTRVFWFIPTYCNSCWGDPAWSEEEVLLKYHWQQEMKKDLKVFDPREIPGVRIVDGSSGTAGA